MLHFVADDRNREVDRFAHGALRRGNRVETRLQLAEDFDELFGSESSGREFFQHVENIAAPEEIFQRALFFWLEEIGQESTRAVFFGDGLKELLGRFGENVARGEGCTKGRGGSIRGSHLLFAGEAEVF